jgi:hypothetical protein
MIAPCLGPILITLCELRRWSFGVTNASRPGGYKAVGTGGKWTPDRGSTIGTNVNLGEQNIEEASFTSATTVHFRVSDDIDNSAKGPDTFVGQVACLKVK